MVVQRPIRRHLEMNAIHVNLALALNATRITPQRTRKALPHHLIGLLRRGLLSVGTQLQARRNWHRRHAPILRDREFEYSLVLP